MFTERYAVVDVETTGFSPSNDRIVEVACVLLDGDGIGPKWSTLVNPLISIPPYATAVHGITDGMVAGAPAIPSVLPELRRFCRGARIVAHCAAFDLSFLGAEFAREALCTMRLARVLFPEAPNHKNQTLRDFLRIDELLAGPVGAHRALDDAVVTAHVLLACRRRFTERYGPGGWSQFARSKALVRPFISRAA
ncbi:MAG TPA: 3'-5' exonuclease [Candidatus Acidoferrales bacterium]|nr:3'-5' exonuclease [Candidatus Acidoferrales bacterium]